MNLLNDFLADLPLTPKKLIEWLKTIIQRIDCVNIDLSMIDSICACNIGTNISSTLSSTVFDEIHEAIVSGKSIEMKKEREFRTVLQANTFDVVSDDFYSFAITYIDSDMQCITLSISKMMGTVYLDEKTIVSLGQ